MECILQSEIYEVIDATFKDIGTSTDYTAWTNDTNLTVERGTAHTTLTQIDTDSAGIHRLNPSITDDLCIECDLYIDAGADYTYIFQFRQDTSNKGTVSTSNFNTRKWQHLKLTVNGTTVNINVDGVEKTPITLSSSSWNRLYLSIFNGATVQYKNFVYYPV